MIRIVVGSLIDLKIEAVKDAAAALGLKVDIRGIKTDSGVHPQPYGRQETLQGALTRALVAHGEDSTAYAVGIENGLVKEGGTTVDLAYVAIITPETDLLALPSEAVPVPEELVRASLAADQSVTAGELEARRSGCKADDPHRVWSGGATDRKTILTETVIRALLAATRTERGASS